MPRMPSKPSGRGSSSSGRRDGRAKAAVARPKAEKAAVATPEASGGDEARTENQRRILEVATREFAEKGLAGARVAEIAEQAGVNKQLLYYYFGSKEGLYSAVLGSVVSVARNLIVGLADHDNLTDVFLQAITLESIERRRTLRRLWMWEALERGDQPILRQEERGEAWERSVDLVRQAQARNEIDPALDPEMVMLGVDAVLNAPHMLPQVTKLITGMDPGEEAFRERLRVFLRQFMESLRPPAAG
jgi:TetR/AcrR family transcriptional regulator